jgi:hypothetical protein
MSSINFSSLFPDPLPFMGLIRALDLQETFQLLRYEDNEKTRIVIGQQLIESHLLQAEKRAPGSRDQEMKKLMEKWSTHIWAVLWHVTEQASMKVKALALIRFFGLQGSSVETLVSGTDKQIHRILGLLDEYAGDDLLPGMTQEELGLKLCEGAAAVYRMMEQNGSLRDALATTNRTPHLSTKYSKELAEQKGSEVQSAST